MSYRNLNEEEKVLFGFIIEDLRFLFSLDEIPSQDIPDIISKLKSDEVRAYVNSLSQNAKPETALREAFFAGRSLFSKFLGGEITPEVNLGPGFIDYILRIDGRSVLVELKSLFEADLEEGKVRRIKRLKQRELRWEQHKDQVLRYIQRGSEFIILTNLRDWFFFNKECGPADFRYFFTASIFDFIEEYNVVGDLWDYLRRKDFQSIREGLDKRFFESLKIWVEKLSEIEFDVDEKTKVELIIRLLNKFMFIQTLDDFFVIDARWVKTNWDEIERKWQAKGNYQVLKEFLAEIDKWFYEYYDTELFRTNILERVKKDEANITKLHDNLQLVLGITYWQTIFSGFKGIMQFNFRYIDEDIFGKAYETFLALVRHDEGIYYTPKYITEYIVENTVGKTFDGLLNNIEKAIEENDFGKAKELIEQFVSIRVLDPACGSGSFLIKTVRKIMGKYRRLNGLLKELDTKYNKFHGSLTRSTEIEDKVQRISELIDIVKAKSDRELISHLLVRHIHGNDLDSKALEVAKVNIWLEAIKLAPTEFRFDKLPKETNHILPDLEMNLVNGNTVVGLPENLVIDFLLMNHKDEISKLSELRKQYLENPTMSELMEQVEEIKRKIRSDLDREFKKHLLEKGLSEKIVEETKPLYWPLELWFLYFINDRPLDKHLMGGDIVIGNPPYERIQVLKKKSPEIVNFLNKSGLEASIGNYDLAVIFIEKGFNLLKKSGEFGYIVTNKFMKVDYGEGIRQFLTEENAIVKIIDFGDQQIFDGATTYTALIFLNHANKETFKYAIVKNLEKNIDQLHKIDKYETLDSAQENIFQIKISNISKEPWIFASSDEEITLKEFTKFQKLGCLSRIFVGLQTSADAVYVVELKEDLGSLVKVYSTSLEKDFVLEKELLKPFLFGRNLKKWFINECKYLLLFPYDIRNGKAILLEKEELDKKYPRIWKYLLENKNILGQRERGSWINRSDWYGYVYLKNMDKFEQPKIMTQVLAYRATFSIDRDSNFYFAGAGGSNGYGITVKNDLSLEYICGILNSNLLDWNLKKISTSHRGGYWIYAKRFLEKLPIKIPETEEEKALSKIIEINVGKIIVLKRRRFELLKLWYEISTRLKNDERTLTKILLQDEESVKKGDFSNIWTSKVSLYPSAKNEMLDREFNDFTLIVNSDKLILKVYGLTGEGKEEEIFEFEFRNKELMLHVYYCLVSALSSHLKINTLKQLLDKTLIPVIQPNIAESTVNIIKKLEDEVTTNTKKQMSELDITKVDSSIIDYEAQIDAFVFKLYGLNAREINVVTQSLGLLPSYQQLVLKHFK